MKNNATKTFIVVIIIIAAIVMGMMVWVGANVLSKDRETPVSTGSTSAESLVDESGQETVVISKEEYNRLKEIDDQYKKVEILKEYIEGNFYQETQAINFQDELYKGLFEALDDPYSSYMTEEEFGSFMEMNEGSYGGIGVVITPGESGYITVVSPIEDTPGERAGLLPGDEIIKVNDIEFTGAEIDEAINNMKGEPGTDVSLSIRRDRDEFNVDITREQIVLKAVKSEMLDNKMGYIRIASFDNKVYEEFMTHLNTLKNQGMKSLVLDLRNNPGGALDQCVKIADEMLGEQVIVSTKTRSGETEITRSDANKLEIPYVILVNEGSASASEILTGAVKDSKSGTIIGTKTFGKGVVQIVRSLIDNTGFKLTISEYFTPNDINIHGVGITPDIVLEDNTETEADEQLDKAIEILDGK